MTTPASTTTLSFTITFHSAFRVGAAYARDGVDAAIDPDDPLPADHLKGLMRSAAVTLLGRDHQAVHAVFGSVRTQSPWAWSSATLPGGASDWNISPRHRVTIDAKTHSAVKDHLVLGEQAAPGTARFTIDRVGAIAADQEETHRLVLRASAAATHALGAWRRRGLGWVGIVPDDGLLTEADARAMLALRETA